MMKLIIFEVIDPAIIQLMTSTFRIKTGKGVQSNPYFKIGLGKSGRINNLGTSLTKNMKLRIS